MRIAVFHNLMSGGAKRVVSEEITRLSARHAVTLVAPATADREFSEPEANYAVITIPFRSSPVFRSPFGRVNPLMRLLDVGRLDAVGRAAARAASDAGADVLLVHPCQVTQAPAVLRHARIATVYYCHEVARRVHEPALAREPAAAPGSSVRGHLRELADRVDPVPGIERAVLRRVDRQHARAATLIACNSSQTASDVARVYGRNAHLCTLAPASRLTLPSDGGRERFVLSVGALAPHKGFDFVIRALATIAGAERPPLVVVSNYQEPSELAFLSHLARDLSVEASFLSAVSEAELARWYARAGCFAYALVREPFGLVVLEAMAAGVPVVAVAEGGILDSVTPGVTGVLCPRDAGAFGRALLTMLSNEALATQLATTARQVVADQWTWERHGSCIETLLEQAIEQR